MYCNILLWKANQTTKRYTDQSTVYKHRNNKALLSHSNNALALLLQHDTLFLIWVGGKALSPPRGNEDKAVIYSSSLLRTEYTSSHIYSWSRFNKTSYTGLMSDKTGDEQTKIQSLNPSPSSSMCERAPPCASETPLKEQLRLLCSQQVGHFSTSLHVLILCTNMKKSSYLFMYIL